MKKLAFILCLLLFVSFESKAQTEIKSPGENFLLKSFDISSISGTDTSFIFQVKVGPVQTWSIQNTWKGVTGAGTVDFYVSNTNDVNSWLLFNERISTTVTGATGSDGWEDSGWSWVFLKVTITKSSITTGWLTMKMNVKLNYQ